MAFFQGLEAQVKPKPKLKNSFSEVDAETKAQSLKMNKLQRSAA